jgi:hypothetical protein
MSAAIPTRRRRNFLRREITPARGAPKMRVPLFKGRSAGGFRPASKARRTLRAVRFADQTPLTRQDTHSPGRVWWLT